MIYNISAENLYHRIIFGSCNNANRQSTWPIIQSFLPDKLVLLGDTVYLDDKRYKKLSPKNRLFQGYRDLTMNPEWQSLFRYLKGWQNIIATYGLFFNILNFISLLLILFNFYLLI